MLIFENLLNDFAKLFLGTLCLYVRYGSPPAVLSPFHINPRYSEG